MYGSDAIVDRQRRFIIFPSAYIQTSNVSLTRASAFSAALVLIVPAYLISLTLAVFQKSWIFRLDILYMPHLIASSVGFLTTVYYVSSHRGVVGSSTDSSNYAITALVMSVLSTIIYGICSFLTFRQIWIVRARDDSHRQTNPIKTHEFIPETEQQRKQLLRLLVQQEEAQQASPDNASQTFKIEWPGFSSNNSNDRSHRSTMTTFRSFPRIRPTSRYTTRRSTMLGGAPPDHLTGGIERVPTIIQEESTMGSSQHGANHSVNEFSVVNPAALRPGISGRAHSALFNTADVDDRSRAPSYCENVHPSMYIDVRSRAALGPNGYPIEKTRSAEQSSDAESQRTEYHLAPPDTGRTPAGRSSHRESRRTREEIELADRGGHGTRLRPELAGYRL